MTLREQLEHRGELRGIEQGVQKQAEETALRMLDAGLPLTQIIQLTGISVEKAEQLKRERV